MIPSITAINTRIENLLKTGAKIQHQQQPLASENQHPVHRAKLVAIDSNLATSCADVIECKDSKPAELYERAKRLATSPRKSLTPRSRRTGPRRNASEDCENSVGETVHAKVDSVQMVGTSVQEHGCQDLQDRSSASGMTMSQLIARNQQLEADLSRLRCTARSQQQQLLEPQQPGGGLMDDLNQSMLEEVNTLTQTVLRLEHARALDQESLRAKDQQLKELVTYIKSSKHRSTEQRSAVDHTHCDQQIDSLKRELDLTTRQLDAAVQNCQKMALKLKTVQDSSRHVAR